MDKLENSSKVLVVSNLRSTGPLWVMNLRQQEHLDVMMEPDPEKCVESWTAEKPALIIFDVNLQQAKTLDLIKSLRKKTRAPIILLVSKWAEEFLVDAYYSGIDECILKPIGPALFRSIVKVWLRQAGYIPAGKTDRTP